MLMKTTLMLMLICTNIFASANLETKSHQEIFEFVQKELSTATSKTLLVLDIDNTVLTMRTNFGSDQWFNWQRSLLETNDDAKLTNSFDELLELQNQIFALVKMKKTEDNLDKLIEEYQRRGISVIALTSRSPEMRNSTERELQRNQIDFSKTAFGHSLGDVLRINDRIASYQNGIFMTSGMNKGEMLQYILNKFSVSYDHIIFVDDHKKHTDNVYSSFVNTSVDITTFRYGKEDHIVEDFRTSSKLKTKALGKQFINFRSKL